MESPFIVRHINPMTETSESELKAGVELPDEVVVRLELDNIQYGIMEQILDFGLQAMQDRAQALRTMHAQIDNGEVQAPAPLNKDDIWAAYIKASRERDAAEKIIRLVKWKPNHS